MRVGLLAPLLFRSVPRMQLFPTDDLPDVPPRQTQPSRGTQMAELLGALVARPENAHDLLQDATPMLLAPFQPNAVQEDDSILRSGMDISEKIAAYSETLDRRISAAKSPETRVALRALRDHVLREAMQLRNDGLSDTS